MLNGNVLIDTSPLITGNPIVNTNKNNAVTEYLKYDDSKQHNCKQNTVMVTLKTVQMKTNANTKYSEYKKVIANSVSE